MALADINIEERKKWDLRPGNTVRVWQKIREGGKTRLQAFEGLIIAHKHGFEPGATFTVRKNSGGIGVERIFPVFSPNIDRIEIVRRSKVRRSKLYYIREKTAKQIRKKMKQLRNIFSEKDANDMEEKKEESVESSQKAQTENKEKTSAGDVAGGTENSGDEDGEDTSEKNEEALKEGGNENAGEALKEEDKKEN